MIITNDVPPVYEAVTDSKLSFSPDSGLTALIDGDPFAYSSASACDLTSHTLTINGGQCISVIEGGKTELYRALSVSDKTEFEALLAANPAIQYESEVTTDDPKNLFHTIRAQINKVIKALEASDMKLFLTDGSSNFRLTENIATVKKYKGNRSPLSKPTQLQEARDYMQETLGAKMCVGHEADDEITILHRQDWEQAYAAAKKSYEGQDVTEREIEDRAFDFCKTVCVTIDKDLRMSAGLHFNPDDDLGIERVRPMGDIKLIRKEGKSPTIKFKGLKGFYAQILSGDSCDNIPKVAGHGPVAVEGLLKDCETEEDLFKTVYRAIYESFLKLHVDALSDVANEKLEVAISSGKHGNDNKTNRTKVLKKIKANMAKTITYEGLHYYHWENYLDKEDGTVSDELKEGAKPTHITEREYLLEVARLLYMLDKYPQEDGSHLWNVPCEKWAEDVESEFEAENIMRVSSPWPLNTPQ